MLARARAAGRLMCGANFGGAVHRPQALASSGADPGRPLGLRAEPDNPQDPHAVAVLTEAGEPVGYVPRELNTILGESWSAVVLRERRDSPRDPRTGLWMLACAEPFQLRVRSSGR